MEENKSTEFTPVQEEGKLISETVLNFDSPTYADEVNSCFIESNTSAISLEDLATKSIVPTFSDNSLTIAHQNFIACVAKAATEVFGDITPIECRVSHPIIGRVPTALYKKASELTEEEKTIFYQRMAFVSHVIGLTREIGGQSVHLAIGGVRAYNEDKLYSRKSPEKFKIFVGWQVRVCSNLCLTCDGYSGTIECMTEADLYQKAYQLFTQYKPHMEDNLRLLEKLTNTRFSEEVFCKIIGRLRLYQALPTNDLKALPEVILGDQAVNAAVRGYVTNPDFGRKPGEDGISCWSLAQILTEAVKSSYIDRWLERNQNAVDFAVGIQEALDGNTESPFQWFLN